MLIRPYSEWLDSVLNNPNTPLTISTSYGDHEQTGIPSIRARPEPLTIDYCSARIVCAPYMSWVCSTWYAIPNDLVVNMSDSLNNGPQGIRGITLLFSSGDDGVGDSDPNPATQQCFTNDGKNVTKFIPTFPSSCVMRLSSCFLGLP
jgi:tripeptidyl-peptidase-1